MNVNMVEAVRIMLAGSGGQGLGQGGKILAEAALYGGKNAAQSQSYGARARGGYSSSTVVISQGEIPFPLAEKINILIALSREAYIKNQPDIAAGGLLLYDQDEVEVYPGGSNEHGFPISRKARENRNEKGATILAIGILVGLTRIVNPDDVETAIRNSFSAEEAEKNRQTFLVGLAAGLKHAEKGQITSLQ